jgi:hypothetical protein
MLAFAGVYGNFSKKKVAFENNFYLAAFLSIAKEYEEFCYIGNEDLHHYSTTVWSVPIAKMLRVSLACLSMGTSMQGEGWVASGDMAGCITLSGKWRPAVAMRSHSASEKAMKSSKTQAECLQNLPTTLQARENGRRSCCPPRFIYDIVPVAHM